MDALIKKLAQAITHGHTQKLVQSHVTELALQDEHLTIFVDNAGPLHELESEELDEHLKKGLEEVYGEAITYELKLFKPYKGIGRENSPTYQGRD